MQTKTLWLSDVKKSNDVDEGKHLLKRLFQYVDVVRVLDEGSDSKVIETAKRMINEYIGRNDFRTYISKGYLLSELEKEE